MAAQDSAEGKSRCCCCGVAVRTQLRRLLKDRSTAERWCQDFFCWTVALTLYWGVRLLLRPPQTMYTTGREDSNWDSTMFGVFIGCLTCWGGVMLLAFRWLGASARSLEAGAVVVVMGHMLLCTVPSHGIREGTFFDYTSFVACAPLFRKTWLKYLVVWSCVCNYLAIALTMVTAEQKTTYSDRAWTGMAGGGPGRRDRATSPANLLMAFAQPVLNCVVYFVVTKVEEFQDARKALQDQSSMNSALLSGLCDGNVLLTADAVTVLRADEKLEYLVGTSAELTPWASHFDSDAEHQRFLTCLENQVEGIPSLVNVTLKKCTGDKFEAELFIVSNRGSTQQSIAVGIRLPKDNCPQAPPASLQPSVIGAALTYNQGTVEVDRATCATADVFDAHKPDALDRIVAQGKKEHWYLKPIRLHFDEDPQGRLCQIGSGGFGAVYRGKVDGTLAALKVAREQPSAHLDVVSANELRSIRRLRHPNIVLFLGASFVADSNVLVVAFEYVDGEILPEFLDKRAARGIGSSNSSVEAAIMQDIVAALRYMHAQEPAVYHNDLKPDNIMVLQENQKFKAKLLDFGLSKVVAAEAGEAGQALGGTTRWRSSEACAREVSDAKTDVYAVGCIGIYTVACMTPFMHVRNPADIHKYLCNHSCEPFDWNVVHDVFVRRQVPEAAFAIFRSCAAYESTLRPELTAVGEELARWQESSEALPHPRPAAASPAARQDRRQERHSHNHLVALSGASLRAFKADVGSHSSRDLVVWLLCSARPLNLAVQKVATGFARALGGQRYVSSALYASATLLQVLERFVEEGSREQSGALDVRLTGASGRCLLVKRICSLGQVLAAGSTAVLLKVEWQYEPMRL
eukprot:TRINITY_DN34413_c0_g1_i3.p1 TRINITY_DN34413_c0_g1~~TRINITY_DN34413_c0_g1_i3.p1  ORF type:complete len:872 (+),score=117.93 TRINITY_DN34413_c0_g1_i3:44-2617(+)